MSTKNFSDRGARIVAALERLADDLSSGIPIEETHPVRRVRVIPEPSDYPPSRVKSVRELIGASQEVFAQLLAVKPVTVRSWEQGLRRPSPTARRFLDEIAMSPAHFRGRILASVDSDQARDQVKNTGGRRSE